MRTPFASLGERRSSIENPSVPLATALLTEWDRLTTAGVSLSPEMAARVPDVFACIQVLSQDVARCPLKLRRINDDGSHEDATDHPMWEVLAELTNAEMTAYQFREEMQRNALTYRRAYAEIVRNGRGEITALWPLDSRYMTVDRDDLNRKRWTYRPPNRTAQVWTFHPSTPPIFELSHPTPIDQCRDLIGLAYALDQFGAKFFANGARPSGTLEVPMGVPLDDEKRKDMRESFQKMHGGSENAGKVAVLYNGVKFNPITIANNEAQYNETRKFIRTLIAGVFRMPPHKIGDLERATFSNIEQQSIDYVTGTLDPILVGWEQAIRRDWLTYRQYPNYTVVFDRQALIKADIMSLFNAFAVARQNGWMNANDILKELGRNPIPGDAGSAYLVNGNMTPAAVAADPEPPAPDVPADPGAAAS
jgi:HK97 family phage portal protein